MGLDSLDDLYDQVSDTEEMEVVLEFFSEAEFGTPEQRVSEVLSEYDLEDLLELNELTEEDAVLAMYEAGIIGLPMNIEDEEEQDLPHPEENED